MRFTDYTNILFNVLDSVGWEVRASFCKIRIIFSCMIQDIHIGKGCKFYGRMKFKRVSKSSISIGDNCTFNSDHTSNLIGVNRPCIIAVHDHYAILTIGNNSGFSGTVIGCFKEIILEDNVRCGANTLITDSDWHQDDPRSGKPRPIKICKNVWLGEGVKVLKGVTIGENSVIGAGSIVTKDIPANVIAAGNPAKIINKLPLK